MWPKKPVAVLVVHRCSSSFTAHRRFPRLISGSAWCSSQNGIRNQSSRTAGKGNQITLLSDDGRKRWSDLTGKERIVRSTTNSGNLLVVILGLGLTATIATFFYLEVLSPDSSSAWFNRAFDRVKSDSRCLRLLGNPKKIKAYGESTSSRWAMARPIAHSLQKDNEGNEHLVMHFNIEGDIDKGIVYLHMVRVPGGDFEYQYLYLDVPGNTRVYLESAVQENNKYLKKKSGFLGVQWGH